MRALVEDDEEEGTSGRVLVGIFCGLMTLGEGGHHERAQLLSNEVEEKQVQAGNWAVFPNGPESGRQSRTSALGSLDGTQQPQENVIRRSEGAGGKGSDANRGIKRYRTTATDPKPILSWEWKLQTVKESPHDPLQIPKASLVGPGSLGYKAPFPVD